MNIFSNLMYNQSFAVKGKVNIKRLIVSLIITIAIEFVAFYVMIPAFNIHSMEFWEFQGFFLLVFFVLTFKTKGKNNIKLKSARCFVPGHWVTVCTGAETYAAKALFIDDAGRLVVEREGGRQIALQHGEVSIRPTRTG